MKKTRKQIPPRSGNNKSAGVPHKLFRYSRGRISRVRCDNYRVKTKKNGQYRTVLETTDEDVAIDFLIQLYGYSACGF